MSAYLQIYRLPTGHVTHSKVDYHKEWESLGARITKLMPDYKLASYDPMLRFIPHPVVDEELVLTPKQAYALLAGVANIEGQLELAYAFHNVAVRERDQERVRAIAAQLELEEQLRER
jgi:hypothetical protein